MNPILTRLPSLACAITMLAFSLSSALGEVLIKDDFGPVPGKSSLVNVAGRHPIKGPEWEGSAKVGGGKGLAKDEALKFSAAFAEIGVPPSFKKLIVKIRYRPISGNQFAFGFTNNVETLRKNLETNCGLMWVNTSAKQVTLHAGIYGSGDKVTNLLIPSTELVPDLVEMEFEVENMGTEAFLCSVVANGEKLASRGVKPTIEPTFRYFFIQFRGKAGDTNQAIVERVSVEAE